MPFKSKAQMRWMFANDPEMAKRWAKHTENVNKIPENVKQALVTLKLTKPKPDLIPPAPAPKPSVSTTKPAGPRPTSAPGYSQQYGSSLQSAVKQLGLSLATPSNKQGSFLLKLAQGAVSGLSPAVKPPPIPTAGGSTGTPVLPVTATPLGLPGWQQEVTMRGRDGSGEIDSVTDERLTDRSPEAARDVIAFQNLSPFSRKTLPSPITGYGNELITKEHIAKQHQYYNNQLREHILKNNPKADINSLPNAIDLLRGNGTDVQKGYATNWLNDLDTRRKNMERRAPEIYKAKLEGEAADKKIAWEDSRDSFYRSNFGIDTPAVERLIFPDPDRSWFTPNIENFDKDDPQKLIKTPKPGYFRTLATTGNNFRNSPIPALIGQAHPILRGINLAADILVPIGADIAGFEAGGMNERYANLAGAAANIAGYRSDPEQAVARNTGDLIATGLMGFQSVRGLSKFFSNWRNQKSWETARQAAQRNAPFGLPLGQVIRGLKGGLDVSGNVLLPATGTGMGAIAASKLEWPTLGELSRKSFDTNYADSFKDRLKVEGVFKNDKFRTPSSLDELDRSSKGINRNALAGQFNIPGLGDDDLNVLYKNLQSIDTNVIKQVTDSEYDIRYLRPDSLYAKNFNTVVDASKIIKEKLGVSLLEFIEFKKSDEGLNASIRNLDKAKNALEKINSNYKLENATDPEFLAAKANVENAQHAFAEAQALLAKSTLPIIDSNLAKRLKTEIEPIEKGASNLAKIGRAIHFKIANNENITNEEFETIKKGVAQVDTAQSFALDTARAQFLREGKLTPEVNKLLSDKRPESIEALFNIFSGKYAPSIDSDGKVLNTTINEFTYTYMQNSNPLVNRLNANLNRQLVEITSSNGLATEYIYDNDVAGTQTPPAAATAPAATAPAAPVQTVGTPAARTQPATATDPAAPVQAVGAPAARTQPATATDPAAPVQAVGAPADQTPPAAATDPAAPVQTVGTPAAQTQPATATAPAAPSTSETDPKTKTAPPGFMDQTLDFVHNGILKNMQPWEKLLVYGGMSLATIAAFSSLFGNSDDDEEGGGWMSLLGLLGAGTAIGLPIANHFGYSIGSLFGGEASKPAPVAGATGVGPPLPSYDYIAKQFFDGTENLPLGYRTYYRANVLKIIRDNKSTAAQDLVKLLGASRISLEQATALMHEPNKALAALDKVGVK